MYQYLYLLCIYTFLQTTTIQCSVQPEPARTLMRRMFSQENLAACNSSQDPEELIGYNPENGYIITTQELDQKIVAATISFITKNGQLFIKALALDPETSTDTRTHAVHAILQKLKPRRQPMACNVEVSEQRANQELREVLHKAGWQQTEEYITLTQQIIPHVISPTKKLDEQPRLDFSIHPFTPAKMETTLELFQNPAIFPWLNSTQEDLRAYLRSPKYTTYTAETANQIIGALVFKATKNRYRIELLAVHPESQHKRVASRMLNYIAEVCQQQEIPIMEINLLARNQPALKCYLANGFQPKRTLRAMQKLPTPGISPQLTPVPEKKDDDAMPVTSLPPVGITS